MGPPSGCVLFVCEPVLAGRFATAGAGTGTTGMAGLTAAAARIAAAGQVGPRAPGEGTCRGHDFGCIGRATIRAGHRGVTRGNQNLSGLSTGLAMNVVDRHFEMSSIRPATVLNDIWQ